MRINITGGGRHRAHTQPWRNNVHIGRRCHGIDSGSHHHALSLLLELGVTCRHGADGVARLGAVVLSKGQRKAVSGHT